MRRWMLTSRRISEVVTAADQFAAWNTLRNRPIEDFGLVVSAEPDENGDPIPVRTSQLMFSWGRPEDARAFIALAIEKGLPDTTAADSRFAS
jgi:hypothetical protein